MEWGVHLPQLGRETGRDTMMNFVQAIEAAGADSCWVSDHVCWPAEFESKYPYTDDGSFPAPNDMAWLEPISTLTFVAACTEKIRLGTTVLILPYRAPVVTAKQLASLDVLSNGRLILGAGIGWMKEEADVLGMPFDQRGARSNEQLEVFHTLFYDETPQYQGQFYQFDKVKFEPKPIQQPVPLWIGGATPAAFKRVAKYGTGFHAAFQPIPVIKDEIAEVRACCEAIGRDPAELTFSTRVYLDPARAMEDAKSIAGDRDSMLSRIDELAAAGLTHIVIDPVARGGVTGRLEAVLEFMEIARG